MILCHAIVHSYVLVPRFVGSGRGGLRLQDFYLASDRGRKKGVYLIDWRTFVDELVIPATSDDVVGMIMRRLPNGEELRIPTSRTDLPTGVEDRLAELYSGLSQSNAKSVDKFMEEWRKAYGTPPDPTPRD
ncbi:hypothetical protein [Streptomyces sirii]|uniref:hypothetical protein n=1 Tax=Streptomyces sirii TaxID=3127701 RepID=UPI003D369AEA